ncbi:MAG: hypothetical protein M0P95_17745 [Sulfuritalea sp.]|jgi:hypothetical protein|nr:hypothetical protein [Sulfuritalea sp.]
MAGIQSPGSNKLMTEALFLESCGRPLIETGIYVRYTLREHAVYSKALQRWIPSACQIYLHSVNEYEAMRRIVGKQDQWDTLCEKTWFTEYLDVWRDEHKHIQESYFRKHLLEHVDSLSPKDIQAIRVLLLMDKPKTRQTKKAKEASDNRKAQRQDTGAVDADHERVVAISRGSK